MAKSPTRPAPPVQRGRMWVGGQSPKNWVFCASLLLLEGLQNVLFKFQEARNLCLSSRFLIDPKNFKLEFLMK